MCVIDSLKPVKIFSAFQGKLCLVIRLNIKAGYHNRSEGSFYNHNLTNLLYYDGAASSVKRIKVIKISSINANGYETQNRNFKLLLAIQLKSMIFKITSRSRVNEILYLKKVITLTLVSANNVVQTDAHRKVIMITHLLPFDETDGIIASPT